MTWTRGMYGFRGYWELGVSVVGVVFVVVVVEVEEEDACEVDEEKEGGGCWFRGEGRGLGFLSARGVVCGEMVFDEAEEGEEGDARR
jgi:hypothetical protein